MHLNDSPLVLELLSHGLISLRHLFYETVTLLASDQSHRPELLSLIHRLLLLFFFDGALCLLLEDLGVGGVLRAVLLLAGCLTLLVGVERGLHDESAAPLVLLTVSQLL